MPSMARATIATWLALVVALLLGGGCKDQDAHRPHSRGVKRSSPLGKISLTGSSGAELCKLKPKGSDFKVYDGSGAVLGKVRVKAGAEADKVTLKGPRGEVLLKIKQKDYGAAIKDGAGAKRYKLKLDGGAWKLKRADGQTLYKLKPRDYGFKLRDADGNTVAKVKIKRGGLRFASESGATLFRLEGLADARAGSWFAADKLSLAERAAIAVFFLKVYR